MHWNQENSHLETELAAFAKRGALKHLQIVEDEEGYYVTFQVDWSKETHYLSNRREREKPRFFHNVDRLLTKLRSLDITNSQITLTIAEEAPKKRPINRDYKKKTKEEKENQ